MQYHQQLVAISVRMERRPETANLGFRTRSSRRALPFSRAESEHMALFHDRTRVPPKWAEDKRTVKVKAFC